MSKKGRQYYIKRKTPCGKFLATGLMQTYVSCPA